jgi:hypothetical protein
MHIVNDNAVTIARYCDQSRRLRHCNPLFNGARESRLDPDWGAQRLLPIAGQPEIQLS